MPSSPNSESLTGAFARVTSQELHTWLHDGQELALIDIHEAGEYGEGHLLLAANIPWSELELQITRRVPRQNTRVVLVSPAALAPLAVRALAQLGYQQVFVLDGGTAAWAAAGLPVFKGIYVPSKAFAECVELARHTTTIEADALHALLENGEDVVVLDSRTAKEYARFHVPGAISCPGSELLLRLDSLVPSPATHVVISCAGRTRGIMGGQTLVDAQVPHRISVLAGGTQGWKLAGYEIEQSAPAALPKPGAETAGLARRRAQALSQSLDIPVVDRNTLAQWQADAQRTTVLLDVRDPSEAQASPITDAIAVAGVQLLQTTDTLVSVHGARLVLADDYGVRSHTTAYWLQQQGWEVAVLAPEDTFAHASPSAPPSSNATLRVQALLRSVNQLDARQAAQWIADGAAIVSVQSSEGFEQVRIKKSVWSHRAAIATGALDGIPAPKGLRWLVVAEDAGIGALAALQLQQRLAAAQTVAVFVLDAAGQQALAQHGVVLDRQAQALAPAQRVDFLYWLHDRHLGNAESSRQYLAWEAQLPAQIGDQRQARFRISPGAAQQV